MSKTTKKVLIGLLCFLVLMIVLSEFGRRQQESLYPGVVIDKFESLRNDDIYSDSIGKIGTYDYTFKYNNYRNQDTIMVYINLYGSKRNLYYEGQFSKSGPGWSFIKDSIAIK